MTDLTGPCDCPPCRRGDERRCAYAAAILRAIRDLPPGTTPWSSALGVARWACPACSVKGQVQSNNIDGTNLAAHARIVHPDDPGLLEYAAGEQR